MLSNNKVTGGRRIYKAKNSGTNGQGYIALGPVDIPFYAPCLDQTKEHRLGSIQRYLGFKSVLYHCVTFTLRKCCNNQNTYKYFLSFFWSCVIFRISKVKQKLSIQRKLCYCTYRA